MMTLSLKSLKNRPVGREYLILFCVAMMTIVAVTKEGVVLLQISG